jgi:hypothetical protein
MTVAKGSKTAYFSLVLRAFRGTSSADSLKGLLDIIVQRAQLKEPQPSFLIESKRANKKGREAGATHV